METALTGVLPVNAAPTLTVPADLTVGEGTLASFTAAADDPDLPADGLTYSLVGAPAGAAIDSAMGVFTWTPTEAQGPADYPFTVRVSDNGTPALFDDEVITVTVNEVNLAPLLDPIGNQAVDEQTPLTFAVGGSDPDLPAQPLTFSAGDLPEGATFDPATRTFAWTPTEAQGAGDYQVTFEVSDGTLTDSETITI